MRESENYVWRRDAQVFVARSTNASGVASRNSANRRLIAIHRYLVGAETPKHNWGFRGLPCDEITLTCRVEV